MVLVIRRSPPWSLTGLHRPPAPLEDERELVSWRSFHHHENPGNTCLFTQSSSPNLQQRQTLAMAPMAKDLVLLPPEGTLGG